MQLLCHLRLDSLKLVAFDTEDTPAENVWTLDFVCCSSIYNLPALYKQSLYYFYI